MGPGSGLQRQEGRTDRKDGEKGRSMEGGGLCCLGVMVAWVILVPELLRV